MNRQRQGHLAGLVFSVVFGLTFMFSKTALETGLPPIGLIAYRFLLAFFLFEALRRSGVIRIRFARAHAASIALVALFQPILYFLFETYGLARTSSGEAGMMVALIPIFATILSTLILKEKPRPVQVLFILLSVSGILLIQIASTLGAFEADPLGFLLLFFAILSAAAFNIASRHASQQIRPVELTYFMMLSGAMVFNILYGLHLLRHGEGYLGPLGDPLVIAPVLYLGIGASIGGFFLLNYALARLQAHVISIYANLSTVIAIAAGAVFLGESLSSYHYVGAAMIISGVYGTVRMNTKARIKSVPHE